MERKVETLGNDQSGNNIWKQKNVNRGNIKGDVEFFFREKLIQQIRYK